MIGTILNAAAVLIGGLAGRATRRQPDAAFQSAVKGLLGVLTVWVGLGMTWFNLGGGFWNVCKQMLIVVLAMTVGRLTGRLLHLQKGMNRLGKYAREQLGQVTPEKPAKPGDAFVTCAILYCIAPLSFLGALFDGLDGKWYTLGIKAAIDGFSAQAFSRTLGWASLLAVVPLVASQGTISLCAHPLARFLRDHGLIESVGATGGLLIFCVALIILNLRKVEVGDYLPSLIFAPIITWFWR